MRCTVLFSEIQTIMDFKLHSEYEPTGDQSRSESSFYYIPSHPEWKLSRLRSLKLLILQDNRIVPLFECGPAHFIASDRKPSVLFLFPGFLKAFRQTRQL